MTMPALSLSHAMEAEVTKAMRAYVRQDSDELYDCLERLAEHSRLLREALERRVVPTD